MSIHDYRNPAHFAPPAHPPESAPAPTATPEPKCVCGHDLSDHDGWVMSPTFSGDHCCAGVCACSAFKADCGCTAAFTCEFHAGVMGGVHHPKPAPDSSPPSPLEELLKEAEQEATFWSADGYVAGPDMIRRLASALRESLAREAAAIQSRDVEWQRAKDARAALAQSRSSVASLTEENATLLRLKEEADDREDSLSQRLAEAEAKLDSRSPA